MVMEAVPSPQCVGREFVRQYYTLLNKAPLHLHRFYNHDSSFVHGGLKERIPEEVHGQQQIHEKIMQLDFNDCKAKILLVDSHRTLENGVVVQVSGELSNNGQPMRRFVQTFVLAPQSAKKYYVRNDIFRYQDDAFFDDEEGGEERSTENENELLQPTHATPAEMHHGPSSIPLTSGSESEMAGSGGRSHPPGINGAADHHIHDEVRLNAQPVTTSFTPVAPIQQQPEQQVPANPPKVATPPVVEEKVLDVAEPVVEQQQPQQHEPVAPVIENTSTKKALEPVVTNTPAAPSEPKTFANLFKNSGPMNGTTPGVPTSLPPFGPAKSNSASTPVSQANNELNSSSVNVNGNENFPPATSAQNQRNNFRNNRPPMTGNGRYGGGSSGPGSYHNRDRDNDRGEKSDRWADNRAPSRDSTEDNQIGEWKQPNGGDNFNRERDREFRRYDDSLQVFVGNIPHTTTEENLKDLFEQFGTVVDVRINGKNNTNMRPSGGGRAPLYAFVVFESAKSAEAALNEKPMLNGDHRLNVEPKRRPAPSGARDGQRGGGGGGSMNRGGGSMNRGGGGMGGPGRGTRPMGSGMGGPQRDGGGSGGGGRGMNSSGRGQFPSHRQ